MLRSVTAQAIHRSLSTGACGGPPPCAASRAASCATCAACVGSLGRQGTPSLGAATADLRAARAVLGASLGSILYTMALHHYGLTYCGGVRGFVRAGSGAGVRLGDTSPDLQPKPQPQPGAGAAAAGAALPRGVEAKRSGYRRGERGASDAASAVATDAASSAAGVALAGRVACGSAAPGGGGPGRAGRRGSPSRQRSGGDAARAASAARGSSEYSHRQ